MSLVITSALLTATVTETVKQLAPILKASASEAVRRYTSRLQPDLSTYLQTLTSRYNQVRTIIDASYREFLPLYVNQLLARDPDNGLVMSDLVFLEDETATSTIISGTGGSGKSMLMRYLLLEFIRRSRGSLPVFLELRRINEQEEVDIWAACLAKIQEIIPAFRRDVFEHLLENGQVILLLDGFDEVDPDRRTTLARQLSSVQMRTTRNRIILSTRPSETLHAIEGFSVLYLRPMNRLQVIELINKLNYEDSVTKKFIAEIEHGALFERHRTFIQIPLLAALMLITYEEHGSIPGKRHLFYGFAFETLFHRHDNRKDGVYRRKRYTSLEIDRFQGVLSAFAAETYFKQMLTFDMVTLLAHIRRGIAYEGLETDPSKFALDLEEAVCIIHRDGQEYTFVHRSFQEYFCALFLSRRPGINVSREVQKILSRQDSDSVLSMWLEMDRDRVERDWVIPTLRAQIAEAKIARKEGLLQFINFFGQSIFLVRDKLSEKGAYYYTGDVHGPSHNELSALHALYFGNLYPNQEVFSRWHTKNGAALKAVYRRIPKEIQERGGGSSLIRLPTMKAIDYPAVMEWIETSAVQEECEEGLLRLEYLLAEIEERSARRADTSSILG
jgi:hypothetical protein